MITRAARQTWPGRPFPLGATWDGAGTGFAVQSQGATAVELCLLDEDGRETAVALQERTDHIWHGYLPDVGPGQRYGYRVDGPFDPAAGHRFDRGCLLVDPYARAIAEVPTGPAGVVVDDAFDWQGDRSPHRSWSETVVYELHVKGFTATHPGVPPELRGTYAGLAHPAAIEHLVSLGVTAVELLPVHHFLSEPQLTARGTSNYWGYNTLAFFAPHAGWASRPGDQVREFKQLVTALHTAGLEVLLDVVYNHTAEGGETGRTLSLRGLDNSRWYRLTDGDRARYLDHTGCGNTLDTRDPFALRLVLDSLRYWVTDMHVDGFRFDLASSLARGDDGFDPRAPFLQAVQQDPVLSQVRLIAEPWDLGPGGYQVGGFPPPFAEWNGRYRDTVRDVWRGAHGGVRELAYRLTGSSDLYEASGRAPHASVNFVTAHDGFTLRDLTTYEVKRNQANGEDGRDGEDHNRSWNCGIEGKTGDPDVTALRARQVRNLLATLLLSTGTPMLSMGDELGRTQGGNNNAYCQDGPVSWVNWTAVDTGLLAFVTTLLTVRREHPVLRQTAFFTGEPVVPGGPRDLTWFGADGHELTDEQWFDPDRQSLQMLLDGRALRTRGPHGEPLVDDRFLVVLHTGPHPLEVTLPAAPSYDVVLSTSAVAPELDDARVRVEGRSVLLLRVGG